MSDDTQWSHMTHVLASNDSSTHSWVTRIDLFYVVSLNYVPVTISLSLDKTILHILSIGHIQDHRLCVFNPLCPFDLKPSVRSGPGSQVGARPGQSRLS